MIGCPNNEHIRVLFAAPEIGNGKVIENDVAMKLTEGQPDVIGSILSHGSPEMILSS